MRFLALIAALLHERSDLGSAAHAQTAAKPDPANTLILELKGGKVTIELLAQPRPEARRAGQAACQGWLLQRHQMAPRDPGLHGTVRRSDRHRHRRLEVRQPASRIHADGIQSRRRRGGSFSHAKDSANSQFFIMFASNPNLNGEYTVWGRVIDGMTAVDAIAKGEPPAKPDTIIKAYLASDAK